MKLDRNINQDGKGKYALVRLRNIEVGSAAWECLRQLHRWGHLDYGEPGASDEFFVIKLRDKYAADGLGGYADAVMADAHKHAAEGDGSKYSELMQYATEVQRMTLRSGALSAWCKEPD
jgi:hypothetical protein